MVINSLKYDIYLHFHCITFSTSGRSGVHFVTGSGYSMQPERAGSVASDAGFPFSDSCGLQDIVWSCLLSVRLGHYKLISHCVPMSMVIRAGGLLLIIVLYPIPGNTTGIKQKHTTPYTHLRI